MEKIVFTPAEDEEPAEFFVLDQTVLRGITYILVTDSEEGDGEALILKDVSTDKDSEAVYVIVDDDTEMMAVAELFRDALEDMGIGLEA